MNVTRAECWLPEKRGSGWLRVGLRHPGLCVGVVMSFLSLVGRAADSSAPGSPLVRAHAHNDYEHQRPLLDALDQGFCSVEADVWLVDGQLRVAHDLKDAQPERKLQKLDLDPLR